MKRRSRFEKRLDRQLSSPPLTPLESRFRWICVWLERTSNVLPTILIGVGTVALGLYPVIAPWVGWAGGAASVVGYILMLLRSAIHRDLEREILDARSKINALEAENASISERTAERVKRLYETFETDKKATYDVLNDSGLSLCDDLKIRNSTTRLSMYLHDEISQQFTRIARVSDNPGLRSTGRLRYPSTQGVIAQVWQERTAIAPTLPKRHDFWIRHQINEYGFTREEAEALTMHSRCMIGVRLDYRDQPVGVLIVESTTEDYLQPSTLDELRSSVVCIDTLPRLLVASRVALSNVYSSEDALSIHALVEHYQ